jgi:two-component system sensor histidine kinase RegB
MVRGVIDVEPSELSRLSRGLRLDTLVRLRWLAIIGQCAAVAGVHFGLGFRLPFGLCFMLIAASVVLNLALQIRYPASHRLSDDTTTFLLGFDILQLALLLYLTGGLQNPFSLLFLAPVLISATALTPQRTLGLGMLAVGCATLLVLVHRPLPWRPGEPLELPFLYVSGVWTAILLGAAFTGVYAWRVAEEARQLAAALAATELVLAREQHISQLDGLAAAAAHELGTPLATIALVAKELARRLPQDDETAEDMRLLREQVERCRGILGKLTSLGQEDEQTEFLETMTLTHLIEEVVAPQRDVGVPIRIGGRGEGPEPVCRRDPGLVHGLDNVVDNAVGFAESAVEIDLGWSGAEVSVEVRDDGPGFAPEVLLRLGEPYVTTRGHDKRGLEEEASGHGLGLFIAKTLIERGGAQLQVSNAAPPARGAIVRVLWPRQAFEKKTPAYGEKEGLNR